MPKNTEQWSPKNMVLPGIPYLPATNHHGTDDDCEHVIDVIALWLAQRIQSFDFGSIDQWTDIACVTLA